VQSELKTTESKLQLVVRSKKVLARIERFEVPVMMMDGRVRFIDKGSLKVYDYLFDEAQQKALRESRELAHRSGLVLEVTDLTRQSPLRRALRFVFARQSPLWSAPNLIVGPGMVSAPAVARDDCLEISSPVVRP
jgi:hypothetical protein